MEITLLSFTRIAPTLARLQVERFAISRAWAAKYSSQASLFSVISFLLFLYFLKNGKPKSAIFSAGTFMPSLIHFRRTETMAELQKE
ncbi:Uncharacterised protein [Streptococcus pneumoniae]|nr:Uncharacterised protein [Streptococcus pneumoniae]